MLPRVCKSRVLGLLACALAGAMPASSNGAEKSADQVLYERIIRRVEPELAGTPDRLPLYFQLFEREMITDTRLFPCQIDVIWRDGRVILSGFVEFEENRTAAEKLLGYLGFESIDNHIELLPSENLGRNRFGLIRSTHSFSYAQPDARSEVLTDCPLGTPVFLLKEASNGYVLCHALEGYVGYVKRQDLQRLEAERFLQYQSGPHVRMARDHVTDTGLTLPLGARLKRARLNSDKIFVALPGGAEVVVPATSCRLDDGTPNPRIERIIQAAERLLGTKYVWGGNTSEGVDCSGLVQTAFATEGITLARDSNQQVLAGRLVATRWYRDALRRGDTLYFLGEHGKIRHTGIYLGDGRYIEAVRPVVRYSSFDPASAEYSKRGEEMFCFAKRLVE